MDDLDLIGRLAERYRQQIVKYSCSHKDACPSLPCACAQDAVRTILRELEIEGYRLVPMGERKEIGFDDWQEQWVFHGGIYDDAPPPPRR